MADRGAQVKYGPATAQVEAMLAVDAARTPEQDAGLAEAFMVTFGPQQQHHRLMPRDYAWKSFHAGVKHHALQDEFRALWAVLISDLTYQRAQSDFSAADAICSTLLSLHVDEGPFRRCDFDMLMAPWRVVFDGCARSRLALQMASSWPYPVDADWWAAVDAVLTETRCGRRGPAADISGRR